MKKLKEVVDKQRDEIRAKDRELTLKNEDIEAVRRQAQPTHLNQKWRSFDFIKSALSDVTLVLSESA